VNEKLSIGGGLDMVLANIIFTSAIDFGTLTGVPALSQIRDGSGDIEADNYSDPGFGINFGLQYLVGPETVFGVSYRSEIDIDFSGDADFTVNPLLGPNPFAPAFEDTGVNAGLTLPASLALSIAHQADKITYLADITWTGWSSFDEIRIEYDNPAQPDSVTTEDWDDTLRYSIGFDYQYTDKMVLRSGLAYDETPIPSPERRTARIPGNDRTWLSFGMTYILNDQSSVDVGYSHLFIDDTKINNTLEVEPPGGPALNATLTGTYSASVDILSVQWNKKF
jgi:long-chain fatty acid transport protein